MSRYRHKRATYNLIIKTFILLALVSIISVKIVTSNKQQKVTASVLSEKTNNNTNKKYTVILTVNDEGDDVKTLQKKLYNIGYDVTVNSKYDAETVAAVKKLQSAFHLKQTGIYTQKTKNFLNKKSSVRDYDKIQAAILKEKQDQHFSALETKIKNYLGNKTNKVGFVYYDINTAHKIAVNEDKVCVAASTYKVGMNMAAYNYVKAGKLSLDEGILYNSKYYESGTGILQGQLSTTLKSPVSVQKLLDLSITCSDNIAKNMITSRLGGLTVVKKTVYDITGATESADISKNTITPQTEFLLLKKLYDERNDQYYAHLLTIMKQTQFHDRIDKYIPHSIVAHKIGSYGSYTNDVGIIFTDKPYIFVIYVDSVSNASDFIADLSKIIYEDQISY